MNFFIPSSKLIQKQRLGSKTIKRYNPPKTHYLRLIESPHMTKKTKQELTAIFESLNPFLLQQKVKEKVVNILNKTQPQLNQKTPALIT